jgi:CheY-like chemotaxis protein
VAPDVATHRIGDPARLRQILVNLLGNAIKFTDTGEVLLRVENAIEGYPPDTLQFSVRDTGIGIPAEKLEVIFESFTQGDTSTTRQYGGTGLGLSISQRLVRLMNGELRVESGVGAGSTFTFTTPLAIDPTPRHEVLVPAIDFRELRVLVVDNNATNCLIVRNMLGHYGAHTTTARGAEEGLTTWRTAQQAGQPFHIALVDGRMPNPDGFYFIEQLRHSLRDEATVVLMLSSDNRSEDRARGQALRVDNYLLKPLSRTALVHAIAEAFRQRDQVPQLPAQPMVPATEHPGKALNILVVEDNEDNQMLIQSYLMKTSHQLTLAENGAVAVECFQADTYDLVLMDVQMPVMDGYCATANIRQWEEANNRPPTCIIALTANALANDIAQSLAAGCDRHLTKPIKKAVLLAAIEEVANSPALTA